MAREVYRNVYMYIVIRGLQEHQSLTGEFDLYFKAERRDVLPQPNIHLCCVWRRFTFSGIQDACRACTAGTARHFVHHIQCKHTYLCTALRDVVHMPGTLIDMHNSSVNEAPTISPSFTTFNT